MIEIMSQKCRVSPKLPWKVRFFVSTMSFAVDISRRSNFTVNRTLMNLFDFKSSASQNSGNGVKSSDIVVDTSCNLWFRLYTPTSNATADHGGTFPVIVFFHGGGFSFMAANSKPYDDFCRRLARELTAIIISVNYRLSPEHRFPSQYEDGLKVLKFIDEWEGLIPINANLKQCFVAGDSAGGNLAHHVAVKVNEHKFHNLKLIGVIAIQPFFGGEERTESEIKLDGAPLVTMERSDWAWKAFLPQGSDRDHPAANVFGPNAVDIGDINFPATIVFVGGFDPLQDWQKRYVEGLKKCGKEASFVEYPNAIHSFYAYPELPESSLFINQTSHFMQKQQCFYG